MNSEILINMTPMETRVARVENGVLQEVSLERRHHRGLVGNIYRGRVARVLPGLQAAFVDIGLDKAGFLHADDIVASKNKEQEKADIQQLLHAGQSVTVQVAKDPIASKGARLTTELSVASRYLVYLPDVEWVGISQRIEDEQERERLKMLLEKHLADGQERGGYIVRTAAEGAANAEVIDDAGFLQQLWQHVEGGINQASVPSCIYEDLPLHLRTVRNAVTSEVEKVRVDCGEAYAELKTFADTFNPEMAPIIELYSECQPLFSLYDVEDEITRALDKRVSLKSGGYLVIEQTEAMVTVDVNTGAFVGHRNLEDTIFKTNLEAATAIAHQLQLRNLGGIIIIDFIDMCDVEHKRQVHQLLENSLARDRTKTTMTGLSELGLVEMTRKRTSESLEQMLCEPCLTCDGNGRMKSAETVCHEILRDILYKRRCKGKDSECSKFLVLADAMVIDRLLDENAANVADLEALVGRPIEFRVESLYPREQYDIIPV